MIIDAHQHYWKLDRGDYDWLIPELKPLYRDFLPDDLKPVLAENNVTRTILVQAAPTAEETTFMLEMARLNDFIAGVVGWADFEAENAALAIKVIAEDPLLVGLRPMIQDIPDRDWILRHGNEAVFQAMVDHHLVFDALVLPIHLKNLRIVVERHADLSIVIDHAAKPPIRDGVPESWYNEITALAEFPNVTCKLSGLITEAAPNWKPEDLKPIIEHLLRSFGPDRLIWGSDWPVLNLAGGYQQWLEVAKESLFSLNKAEQSAIFGGNAARVYLSN